MAGTLQRDLRTFMIAFVTGVTVIAFDSNR
jgi:hypothetical protein